MIGQCQYGPARRAALRALGGRIRPNVRHSIPRWIRLAAKKVVPYLDFALAAVLVAFAVAAFFVFMIIALTAPLP